MLGARSSPIVCSIYEGGWRPPRPDLIKQDWDRIAFGVIWKRIQKILSREDEHIGRETAFLPLLVTTSFCALGLLLPHSVMPAGTATAGLHACLLSLSHNSHLLWPLIKSCQPIQAFISWQLMHFYKCKFKSFICFPLLKMHSACGKQWVCGLDLLH